MSFKKTSPDNVD